ncbi:MAG TPA: DUF1499 domain-containing protein [Thermoanaerobaculia bacterium]|nr:DUF1499 domain-containing protein [Thermoanaerobaculia bacterium]HSK75176.1 DUF1499 domain-containing protein [Thermoanaerobaculia bacterium]
MANSPQGLSRLAPCPRTPNCVSTQAPLGPQHIEPIRYTGSLEEARERLLRVLREHPRTTLVREEPGYLKAECRSALFRFVDDVEFVFDDAGKWIHFRSASRLGRKDFGVNRKRMEEIRRAFEAAGA